MMVRRQRRDADATGEEAGGHRCGRRRGARGGQVRLQPPLLRGKTVPGAAVRARLEAGQLLTPATCGWHYVEGLRKDDDSRLALFWDKAGLGHNGERLSGGGHAVWFVSTRFDYVPGERWEAFLAKQERLRAAVRR